MITYTIDILILVSALAGLIGLWVGVLLGYWINKEAIEKSKAKKLICREISNGEKIYKCPNCKGLLSREYDYCHKCGQALIKEWSN